MGRSPTWRSSPTSAGRANASPRRPSSTTPRSVYRKKRQHSWRSSACCPGDLHAYHRQVPLRQYRLRAWLGRRVARDTCSRVRLLVLRQARWRLDLQSKSHARRRCWQCRALVEVRLRYSHGHVLRLLALRRGAGSYQRDRGPPLCGRQRERFREHRAIVASTGRRKLRRRRR